jgi:hypothetical protein
VTEHGKPLQYLRTDEAKREPEEKCRDLSENANDAIFIIDSAWTAG